MFTLDHVVPWGRSFDEYRRMFSLTEPELRLRICGCGDGPASFNAEATRRGTGVVSFDPIYKWDASQLRERIAVTRDQILDETRRNARDSSGTRFVRWRSSDRSAWPRWRIFWRTTAAAGRRASTLTPNTRPCADSSFDLALCSHFLFLYSTQLGETFHSTGDSGAVPRGGRSSHLSAARFWAASARRSRRPRLSRSFAPLATTCRLSVSRTSFNAAATR